jgi:hypothetical protein
MERQQAALAEAQKELERTRDARNARYALTLDKGRAEGAMRELEARLARSASPETPISVRSRMASIPPAKLPPALPPPPAPMSIPPAKLPPASPPPPAPMPAGPPPPPPPGQGHGLLSESVSYGSSVLSSVRRSSGSDGPTTPTTSAPPSVAPGTPGGGPTEPRLLAQVAAHGAKLEEQDTMIRTLEKQLAHCEQNLQTHIDLVNTLEGSLKDREKNHELGSGRARAPGC